jgi:predicted lipid-binding transport protein (Tim44 family)
MARIGGVQLGRARQAFEPTDTALHEFVRESFPRVQQAWTDRDVETLSGLTTDAYVARARPVIDDLDKKLRVNRIENADLCDVAVSQPEKGAEATQREAYLAFVLRDWLEDLRTTEVVSGDPETLLSFVERWSFRFDDARGWLLDRVSTVWEGRPADGRATLRDLPAGRYSRPQAPARWVEWDGSAWTG